MIVQEYADNKSSEYTQDEEDDDSKGGIRININKNKQILEHLAKFTKEINPELMKKEGMTLLFYDFNGSKSSLTSRTNTHKNV
jgi:hypothetical protein